MSKIGVLVLSLTFVIAMIILGPVLAIWAWNTLFGALYGIPYTIETWVAVIVLGMFLRAKVSVNKG